jgi:hypothetical protein
MSGLSDAQLESQVARVIAHSSHVSSHQTTRETDKKIETGGGEQQAGPPRAAHLLALATPTAAPAGDQPTRLSAPLVRRASTSKDPKLSSFEYWPFVRSSGFTRPAAS